jgi:GNAT superfamily N-acetyltransferase
MGNCRCGKAWVREIGMKISVRLAEERDVPELGRLIELSVRGLQAGDYSAAQLERALAVVYGVDTRLIEDGTYFLAEARSGGDIDDGVIGTSVDSEIGRSGDRVIWSSKPSAKTEGNRIGGSENSHQATVIVGCGGWSRRRTLYGGDQFAAREDSLLDPATEAAKIRAFFVHPEWARRGIGGMILDACERAAIAEGFHRLEMGATLTGVPFYRVKGYVELEQVEAPLGDGLTLPIVRMGKSVIGD